MKIIVISGTPGCGKTSVSKRLTETLNTHVITLNELAILKNFIIEYDRKRETSVIDTNNLIPHLIHLIEERRKESREYLIIEGHFADIVPNELIDYAIVLRCDPEELYHRLQERGYKKKKIIENIQSEILGNCVNFFIQKKIKKPLFEIDTTNLKVDSIVNIILDIINGTKNSENFYVGKIDWMEKVVLNDTLAKKYFYNEK